MAGEKRNEESEKKREWNDGDATLHSISRESGIEPVLLI